MSPRRITASNSTLLYVIALVVIVGAFIILGGGVWLKGMVHGGRSLAMGNWNWIQILIGLGIGFLLGFAFAKRKW